MIRINKLLRTARIVTKVSARAGPGWDRPDVPPTQNVQRDTRFTQEEIIYTFFDSSMPEFFLTEPEVYEGGLMEGLPTLLTVWGTLFGTAFFFYIFNQVINPHRTNKVVEPDAGKYFMDRIKKLYEQKTALKLAKENPFGIYVNSEKYPFDECGYFYYPPKYYVTKASMENLQKINTEASNYLKAAWERAAATH